MKRRAPDPALAAALGLTLVASNGEAVAADAGLVDCLDETWLVVRFDRALTTDERAALTDAMAPLRRDVEPEAWWSGPDIDG